MAKATLSAALKRLWEDVSGPLPAPLAVFIASRLALFALVLFLVGLFPVAPDKKPAFLSAFSTWDGWWYGHIAAQGYEWRGPEEQSGVVWFPLYPMLGRALGRFVGGPRTALFLISNGAFLVYLYYLYRLVREELDPECAYRTILYVALFPVAFIFACLYSESLFMALTVSSFYYARRGRWPLALPLAALASLTRVSGLIILLPLAYEFVRQKGWVPGLLALASIPAATALYPLYLWRRFGDPLLFLKGHQAAWHRLLTWPWGTLATAWKLATTQPREEYLTAIAMVDLACMLLFLGLIVAALRALPAAYWLYALPVFLFSTATTADPTFTLPTMSLSRFMLALFPGFIVLGMAGRNRYVHHAVLFVFSALLGILSICHFSRLWVC